MYFLFRDILFLLRLHSEFDKNADSIYVSVLYTFRIKFVERQIGVCVFCALASVNALFDFLGRIYEIWSEKTEH